MTFQTGQSISEVGNISTLYYRCLHARHKQTNKTSSFRKHRSYVRLCISLRSMQLAGSSALLQCNGLYDAACRWWRQRGSVPVPCPCAEGGQAPEMPLGGGCAVPAGPFPLWAPARKVSELCGKRKGSERSKWTKCHAWDQHPQRRCLLTMWGSLLGARRWATERFADPVVERFVVKVAKQEIWVSFLVVTTGGEVT